MGVRASVGPQHQVDWDATRVLDRAARPVQLKVKEALHIERTSGKTAGSTRWGV